MNPWPVVRAILAALTVVFVGLALITGDLRWWAASAATGTMWWVWDLIVEHVLEPLEVWIVQMMSGDALHAGGATLRPSLDETIEYLERHLANPTSRKVDINAAVRLEEIYRTVKNDPARAQRVIEIVRERYPDAPELERFSLGAEDEERRGASEAD